MMNRQELALPISIAIVPNDANHRRAVLLHRRNDIIYHHLFKALLPHADYNQSSPAQQ